MLRSSQSLRVSTGLLEILYGHSLIRNFANVFLVTVVVFSHHPMVRHGLLWSWGIAGLAIFLFREYFHLLFNRQFEESEAADRKWLRIYVTGLLASGIHWFVFVVFVTRGIDAGMLTVDVLIIAGVTSAGYLSSCMAGRFSIVFLCLLVIGTGIRILEDYPEYALTTVMSVIFYFIFIQVVAKSLRKALIDNLHLYFEKDELAKELERERQKAVRASEEKTRFLGVTSHEIRTSVNGIVGMMQVLEDSMQTAAEMDYLATMRKSSSDLLNHLNNLLDLNKIEEGKLTLENRTFDWVEEVKAAVDLFRGSALQKRLELKMVINEDSIRMLQGDSVRLGANP